MLEQSINFFRVELKKKRHFDKLILLQALIIKDKRMKAAFMKKTAVVKIK